MVAWAAFAESEFRVTKGQAKTINSSGASMRSFCADCGTGLYFTNVEHPDALAMQMHIQTAHRIGWMEKAHELPHFRRFPGME
jgi:hypothetical protein